MAQRSLTARPARGIATHERNDTELLQAYERERGAERVGRGGTGGAGEDGGGAGAAGGSEGEGDTYEKTKYGKAEKALIRFQARVALEPYQCIRYAAAGRVARPRKRQADCSRRGCSHIGVGGRLKIQRRRESAAAPLHGSAIVQSGARSSTPMRRLRRATRL